MQELIKIKFRIKEGTSSKKIAQYLKIQLISG